MPGSARLHVPGGYYHVVLHGNHREVLFDTVAAPQILNDIVADAISRHQELAERICHEHHIGIERLRSLSRARELTPTRLDFITQAINLRMATLAELARFLHRDPSALTKLLARHPHPSQTRP
jgi:hypothetical protein